MSAKKVGSKAPSLSRVSRLADVESRDHLVIVEGSCRSVIKHEDTPEHGDRRLTEDFFDRVPEGRFVFRVFRVVVAATRFTCVADSRYVGVNATVTPSAAPGLIGLIHLAGYRLVWATAKTIATSYILYFEN